MKVSAHIAYYHYSDEKTSGKRSKYLISMINDYFNQWEVEHIDIFIHTNTEDAKIIQNSFLYKSHIQLYFIVHNLSNENPHNLTWKHRELMVTQKDKYDIFLYLEDDIGIPYKAFKYWLDYKHIINSINFDIGFIRIEKNDNNEIFCTDILLKCELYPLINTDMTFAWNHQHYCAFWICDKDTLVDFMNSKYWNKHGFFPEGYGKPEHPEFSRESAASGYKMSYPYPGSLFPVDNNTKKILDICFVYHLANNYVNSDTHLGHFPVSSLT